MTNEQSIPVEDTDDDPKKQPVSQQSSTFRERLPLWMRKMPQLRFPEEPRRDFQLLPKSDLDRILNADDVDPAAAQRIRHDVAYMEYELLRLFRERDYFAKFNQNRYRIYQITYMVLAALATLFGSFLALSLDSSPSLVPLWAFGETAVALVTTYVAALSSREPPLPLWLENRRRAEYLRREYFRYLANLSPYDQFTDPAEREMTLSKRAADINRGAYVDSEQIAS